MDWPVSKPRTRRPRPKKPPVTCYFGCEHLGALYRFPPPNPMNWLRFKEWQKVLSEADQNKGEIYIFKKFRLCYLHFEQCYYNKFGSLTKNAIPTLNIPKQTGARSKMATEKKCQICGITDSPDEYNPKGIYMVNFPLDPELCKQWVKLIGSKDLARMSTEKLYFKYICKNHFGVNDFDEMGKLDPDAVPSLKFSRPPLPDEMSVRTNEKQSINTETNCVEEIGNNWTEENFEYPSIEVDPEIPICAICLRMNRILNAIDGSVINFFKKLSHHKLPRDMLVYCSECETTLKKCYNFKRKCTEASRLLLFWAETTGEDRPAKTLLHEQLGPSKLGIWERKNIGMYYYNKDPYVFKANEKFEFNITKSPSGGINSMIMVTNTNESTPVPRDNVFTTTGFEESVTTAFHQTEIMFLEETVVTGSEESMFLEETVVTGLEETVTTDLEETVTTEASNQSVNENAPNLDSSDDESDTNDPNSEESLSYENRTTDLDKSDTVMHEHNYFKHEKVVKLKDIVEDTIMGQYSVSNEYDKDCEIDEESTFNSKPCNNEEINKSPIKNYIAIENIINIETANEEINAINVLETKNPVKNTPKSISKVNNYDEMLRELLNRNGTNLESSDSRLLNRKKMNTEPNTGIINLHNKESSQQNVINESVENANKIKLVEEDNKSEDPIVTYETLSDKHVIVKEVIKIAPEPNFDKYSEINKPEPISNNYEVNKSNDKYCELNEPDPKSNNKYRELNKPDPKSNNKYRELSKPDPKSNNKYRELNKSDPKSNNKYRELDNPDPKCNSKNSKVNKLTLAELTNVHISDDEFQATEINETEEINEITEENDLEDDDDEEQSEMEDTQSKVDLDLLRIKILRKRVKHKVNKALNTYVQVPVTSDGYRIDKDLMLWYLKNMSEEDLDKLDKALTSIYYIKCPPELLSVFAEVQKKYERQYADIFDIIHLDTKEKVLSEFAKKDTKKYRMSKYKCELCICPFKCKKTLDTHMEEHSPAYGDFECGICHVRRKSKAVLKSHIYSHQILFKCRLCTMVTNKKSHMKDHTREHMGHSYVCEVCGVAFNSMNLYSKHKLKHRIKHVCEFCAYPCASQARLDSHKKSKHANMDISLCSDRMWCEQCDVVLASLAVYKKHCSWMHKDTVPRSSFHQNIDRTQRKPYLSRTKHKDQSRKVKDQTHNATKVTDSDDSTMGDADDDTVHKVYHTDDKVAHTVGIVDQTDDIAYQTDDNVDQSDDVVNQSDDLVYPYEKAPPINDIVYQTDDIVEQTVEIMDQSDNVQQFSSPFKPNRMPIVDKAFRDGINVIAKRNKKSHRTRELSNYLNKSPVKRSHRSQEVPRKRMMNEQKFARQRSFY